MMQKDNKTLQEVFNNMDLIVNEFYNVIEETKQKPTEEKTEKKILSQYCKK
jgi:hypothetical protein